MKKYIYILFFNLLLIIIINNIFSCKNKNINNIYNKKINNKYKTKILSQIPPKDSNWKLINISYENLQKEIIVKNNKWYILIGKNKRSNDNFSIFLFNSKWDVLTINSNISFGNNNYFSLKNIISIYYWNNNKKPKETINIDKNTGKIINWNKK